MSLELLEAVVWGCLGDAGVEATRMLDSGDEVVTFRPTEVPDLIAACGGVGSWEGAVIVATVAASGETLLLRRSDLAGRLGEAPDDEALEVPAAAAMMESAQPDERKPKRQTR